MTAEPLLPVLKRQLGDVCAKDSIGLMMNEPNTRISCRNSPSAPAPVGHYSHVCSAGGLAFISGQLPIRSDGAALTGEPFEAQAHQVLRNLQGCLEAMGLEKKDLVQVRVYVTSIRNWPLFNEIYSNWIGAHRPARAVAGVSELHFGLDIEIEAVAFTDSAGKA